MNSRQPVAVRVCSTEAVGHEERKPNCDSHFNPFCDTVVLVSCPINNLTQSVADYPHLTSPWSGGGMGKHQRFLGYSKLIGAPLLFKKRLVSSPCHESAAFVTPAAYSVIPSSPRAGTRDTTRQEKTSATSVQRTFNECGGFLLRSEAEGSTRSDLPGR